MPHHSTPKPTPQHQLPRQRHYRKRTSFICHNNLEALSVLSSLRFSHDTSAAALQPPMHRSTAEVALLQTPTRLLPGLPFYRSNASATSQTPCRRTHPLTTCPATFLQRLPLQSHHTPTKITAPASHIPTIQHLKQPSYPTHSPTPSRNQMRQHQTPKPPPQHQLPRQRR
ncbi:hypothetical protein ETH_00004025 [Eimeria tenella]|uniref:Uncharacterized protein n=1 Tax=Eimeria tenella TaxID=5802 RepID=U6L8Z0_EIMTE|nr:hypothetical protein ETH_00004025 [Eimeria tenella]CDJ45004.1 hypothetical protein ETH_00004025 [Eimeria tenella]|eukprot:XP_013235751.1 hypothetical protein ETH_00004025 [Eimeria tenella]